MNGAKELRVRASDADRQFLRENRTCIMCRIRPSSVIVGRAPRCLALCRRCFLTGFDQATVARASSF